MSIQKNLEKFIESQKEFLKIKEDIRKYRNHYKERLNQLQKEMDQVSNNISLYLSEHNHPAINYNGLTIQKKEKTEGISIARKKKKESLKNIKNTFHLSDECYSALQNQLIGDEKNITTIATRKPRAKKKKSS